jgi:hypothetical protein
MTLRTISALLVSVFLAAGLSGCASHGTHSMAQGSHSGMDMKSMCDMHTKMMGSGMAAQHQAMMADHMKDMPKEKVQEHMQMMEKNCK